MNTSPTTLKCKVDSEILNKLFISDLLNECSYIIHGLGSIIEVLRIAVQEADVDIIRKWDLGLKKI